MPGRAQTIPLLAAPEEANLQRILPADWLCSKGRDPHKSDRQPHVIFRDTRLRSAAGGDVVEFGYLHRPFERTIFGEAVHQAGE